MAFKTEKRYEKCEVFLGGFVENQGATITMTARKASIHKICKFNMNKFRPYSVETVTQTRIYFVTE